MRHDIAGMFWDDTPPPKVLKEKIKRTPPERTWERPDYLPYLEEATRFDVPLLSNEDLYLEQLAGNQMLFDVEVYPNYFLASFTSFQTGKTICFEMDESYGLDTDRLRWIMQSFCIVGFNSISYDLPIVSLAVAGADCEQLQWATEEIILRNESGRDVVKKLKAPMLKCNHIDLIEVAPLRANLKIYGGRLHCPRMQDLPFPPGTRLTPEQKHIVRWYNVRSDLVSTAFIFRELSEQIKLRDQMSIQYAVDLRSKSDAQIAEAVISHEVKRLTGMQPRRPQIEVSHFFYQPPAFLKYESALLNHVFQQVCTARFQVGEDGTVGLPAQVLALRPEINGSVYQMGLGGLHSNEQKVMYFSSAERTLLDRDVTGYYPSLILGAGMYPPQLGKVFIPIYKTIVDRRVEAKRQKNKPVAESLKITSNGTFGKLGSPYSILYAPPLLIQVTVTGQLSLLMLIERMEMAGIHVVSGNTDGIVMDCPNELRGTYEAIIAQWEKETGLQTEETIYSAYYARDVNNYLAVKPDGKVKAKGAYSNPWADPDLAIFRFHKNPVNLICTEAVEKFLVAGVPILTTVSSCRDVSKFITVRSVRGGAVKDGEYLGKSIRWYYALGEEGEIIYASNGHTVPRTKGARPLMDLPAELPADLDFDWYVMEAFSMLRDLGLAV